MNQIVKKSRRDRAARDYQEAATYADACNMHLIQNHESHYTLISGNRRIEIWPGTQKISPDLGLNTDRDWTLMEIVKAVDSATATRNSS